MNVPFDLNPVKNWAYVGFPIKPSPDTLKLYEEALNLLTVKSPQITLLGIVPELFSLFTEPTVPWAQSKWIVECKGSTKAWEWLGIPALAPGQNITLHCRSSLNKPQRLAHMILGDGALLNVPASSAFSESLVSVLRNHKSYLLPGGYLVLRTFTHQERSYSRVAERLSAGLIPNIHALKLEVADSLQLQIPNKNLGVRADEVYHGCKELKRLAIRQAPGWYKAEWNTLKCYKNCKHKLYFHDSETLITAASSARLKLVKTLGTGWNTIRIFQNQ
jgi:hypothetical protein